MRLIGVDGCPAGWMVAERQLAGSAEEAGKSDASAPSFRIVRTFAELLASLGGERAVIALDIPVGLPSGQPAGAENRHPPGAGSRLADRAARAFLGGHRASSVFSAPCRPTLDAADYAAACASELAARGKKLSKQAFGILPKIREVDLAISQEHQLPLERSDGVIVREVHPEIAFGLLRGGGEAGCGLVTSKRSSEGEAERLALLRPYFPALDLKATRDDLRQQHRAQYPKTPSGRIVGRDDIVDALVCLVVAGRIAAGHARTFPENTVERDARGLRMEISG